MKLKNITAAAVGCIAAVAAVITATAVIFTPPKIYISEICPTNSGKDQTTAVKDKEGNYCDWIEIYNPTDKDVSLSSFSLSKNDGAEFSLGDNIVKAHSYTLVYCSKNGVDRQDIPHADISIGKVSKDKISLRYRGFECESITLPELDKGVSYSRDKNGEMYVSDPTPMAENAAETIGDTPTFSKSAGSYESAFKLEISAGKDQTIYYTTDGTDPESSDTRIAYTEPIEISDRKGDKNVLSAYDPMKIQLDYRESISLPKDSDVDKGTVIRACAEGTSGKCGRTVTATYFVGVSSADHNDLPIISMTTDPDGLYNEKTGIYCLGDVYKEYDEQYPDHAWNGSIPANYNQRGKAWEKSCYIEYFDSEGNTLLSQDCGVRIQGGWSRADYQKSFRFYARSKYGKSSFENVFWSDNTDKNGDLITSCKTFVLRNGGNDANYCKFKDTMTQKMVAEKNADTQKGTACVLFIDGEYWGLYTLQTDYSEEYFSDKYGVSEDNVVMYKNEELSIGEEQDEALFTEMCEFISSNDMSVDANYKKACTMLDMDNFADYIATEFYIFNDDWPQNNYACWRTRTFEQGNEYGDCRWRFVLFDTESSANHYNEKNDLKNMFAYLREHSDTKLGGVITSLLENKTFQQKFVSAICQTGSVNFAPDRYAEFLQSYKDVYYGELDNYFKRFPTWAKRKNATDPMLQRWQTFVETRYNKVMGYLEREFLLSERREVEISSEDFEKGTVEISGVTLETAYKGEYFDDCEITLTAKAIGDYHFDHWEGVDGTDSENDVVTVTVKGDMRIKAVFKKNLL